MNVFFERSVKMKQLNFVCGVTVCLVLLFCQRTVLGEDHAGQRSMQKSHGDAEWRVRFGAAVKWAPEYQGSDAYEIQGLPVIDVLWRDRVFLNPYKGLGAYLLTKDNWRLAASIGYAFGRDEDDSDDLNGMGDVDSGATANLFWEWQLMPYSVSLRYEQQISGEDTGVQLKADVGRRWTFGRNRILRASVNTVWASGEYMNAYFDVTQTQALASGYNRYESDSGIKSFGADLLWIQRVGKSWSLQMNLGYDYLLDEVNDSPVVTDEHQFSAVSSVVYQF